MGDYLMTIENKLTIDTKRVTFDKKFDKLNLKSFAENLLKSIEKGTASSIGDIEEEQGAWTISLNAEFGNGKTTFLKMFKHFIEDEKNHNYNVIFINAWTADFYSDPIIAILSKFVNLIQKNQEIQEDKKKEITNEITKIIGKISNHKTTKLMGNIANQFIDKKIGINIKDIISSCREKPLKPNQDHTVIKSQNILEGLNQIKLAMEKLKVIIQQYTKDKKLIIIVDELDRARPDYAVHFLEDIKHFFDIKNVIFLVGVNRQQMEATVKCLYGKDLKFEGYYRKFFKQEIDLPDPYKEAQNLVDALMEQSTVRFSNQRNDRSYRVSDSYLSCKIFNLTLREIEMFVIIFESILGSETQNARWVEMNCSYGDKRSVCCSS